MHAVSQLLIFLSGVVILACLVWLHWRALQDGAFQDVILFVTGVSLLYYVFRRWDRARRPVLGIIGSTIVLAATVGLTSTNGATPREPSAEEVAAEVKPLILSEWKKNPTFANATIQSISLTNKGAGRYSGSVEATLDGRPERLALEVVRDQETISWELKSEVN